MRATCNRKSFLASLSAVSGVVPSRSPKPILSNVRFAIDHDGIATLAATDLELGVVHRVLGVNNNSASSPGSAILPPTKLAEMFAKAPDIEMVIDTGDGKANEMIHIRGSQAKYKLPGEDPSLFPSQPDWAAENWWTVKAGDLKRAIRRTQFATDVESTRFALGGVLVEVAESSLKLVGTDGRRLATMRIDAEATADAHPPLGSPVVPLKALKLLDRLLVDEDLSVDLAFVGGKGDGPPNSIMLRTSDGMTTVYSRLVEGRFPKYAEVFPTEPATRITLDVAGFRQSVEQAAIFVTQDSRSVDFSFGMGELKLECSAADSGQAEVTLMIDHIGSSHVIAFDPRYCIDFLKVIDDDEVMTVDVINEKHAAVFKVGSDYIVIVMPLTRDR